MLGASAITSMPGPASSRTSRGGRAADDTQPRLRVARTYRGHDLAGQPASRIAVGQVGEGAGEEERVGLLASWIKAAGSAIPYGLMRTLSARSGGQSLRLPSASPSQ